MTVHPGSHSELFGLYGQDESGLANKFGKRQDPPKEGSDMMADAAAAETERSSLDSERRESDVEHVQRTVEKTLSGMSHDSGAIEKTGSGGSLSLPSDGEGKQSAPLPLPMGA